MATVVNLPPDPSFGSGRVGGGIGKLLSFIIEGRRKKRLDEERSEAIELAFDAAKAEVDFDKQSGVFFREVMKAPGIKATAGKALTDTFIETRSARREAKEVEALADIFGESGGDVPKSGKAAKPIKEGAQPKIDRETFRVLGSKALDVLKLLSQNRKAASTAKLNDAKIQRGIDQTKNDISKLEDQKARTGLKIEQLKLSKASGERSERQSKLNEQSNALNQRIEDRRQALADLNATKAQGVEDRAKRKQENDDAITLIAKAKEERALEEFERTPAEQAKRISKVWNLSADICVA